jgi:hypothetical protein
MAEYDRAIVVARMRAGKQRSGKWGGRPSYHTKVGYGNVLNRIWHLRSAGLNLKKIAETLNVEGHKTMCGGQWFPQQISRILRKKNPYAA